LISFIIAFFFSALVIFASRKSYQQYVEKSLESGNYGGDGRDSIDKIDDPFDLYSDEVVDSNKSEKEIFKEEKRRVSILKQKKEILKALPVNFSILRLASYTLLVFGFIYLQESGNLNITLYLSGITAGILTIAISTLLRKK